ncbi:TrkH family potassium uptake protein [Nonlabens ponticola]|uniref:Potassium transporter TrkH n=1 Tax=Nonlabens ponticola TaxID=2496866 RepID=A0A3S9MVU8_9FLAO|nr:potassium transporter TrkG [Nonlabens ponticola]AZQ43355.1 potassium transporter TrkH [Nonlabens ponticola]
MSTFLRKYNRFLLRLSPQSNLVYGFFIYNLIGFLLLCLPFARKTSLSVIDVLFASTSAISTTGLLTLSMPDDFTFFGQFVIMLLFQIGGIGYMTFTTYILLNTNKKASAWRQRILSAAFSLPDSLKLKPFLKSVIVFTVIFEVIGTIFFYIGFADQPWGFWERLWNSFFHSVSAFCTAGFSLFNSGFIDYVGDGWINFTISLLAISGSLGFIVFTDLWMMVSKKKHKLSFTSKIIVSGFVCLLLAGTSIMYFAEPVIASLKAPGRFYAAFFQSMSAMTTVGFNTLDFGSFGLAITMITILLMYIGASPSGTSGGLKITTFIASIAYLRSRLKNCKDVLFLNRFIPEQRVHVAVSTFIFYLMISFLGILLLSFSEDFPLDRIAFETLSALGTVGLSTGITGDLTIFGKIVIIILMFIGRLGVLTFGLAISRTYIATNHETKEDLAI